MISLAIRSKVLVGACSMAITITDYLYSLLYPLLGLDIKSMNRTSWNDRAGF